MEYTQIDATEIKALAARLIQIEDILDGCKPLYEEKETIALHLNALIGTGDPILVPGSDKVISVIDNFADKNCIFRPAAVRRIEVKIEVKEAYDKRMKRAMKSDT